MPEALPAGYDRLPEQMRTRLADALEARKARWAAAEADLDDLLDGMPRMEFLLRFTLSHPDLHTTIVGTSNRAHLADNVAVARKGPLPTDVYDAAREKLGSVGGE